MKKLIIAIVFMFFSCQTVMAGNFFIEPNVGYGLGSHESDLVDSLSGIYFGAKAGISFGIPFVGADFLMGMPTESYTIPLSTDQDKSDTSIGVIVGAGFPAFPLRLWGGYYFIHNSTYDSNNDKLTGSAIKFGLGYSVVPLVSLNAEYIMGTYDERESGGTTTAVGEGSDEVNIIYISLSVPFTMPF